jgi:predicted nuclease with TOPRIM domain
MSSATIHAGNYAIELIDGRPVVVIDTRTGYRLSSESSPSFDAALRDIVQEIQRLRGSSMPAGTDVWERLRVATIHESQLNAALLQIAQACGLSPMVPNTTEGIVAKAKNILEYKDHLAADRDGLKAQRDRAEGTLASVRRELEHMTGQRDQLKHERDTLTMNHKALLSQFDELQAKSTALQKHITDAFRAFGCLVEPPPEQLVEYAKSVRTQVHHTMDQAQRVHIAELEKQLEQFKKTLSRSEQYLLDALQKVRDALKPPEPTHQDQLGVLVQQVVNERDQLRLDLISVRGELDVHKNTLIGVTAERDALKADDSMGVVYKLGRHLQNIADILGFPKKVGAYTWEDVVERVKQVREHQQELLSRPKVTAGHLEEVMRRRLARQGGTPELCDIREMIIIALREAQVIS